MNLTFPAASNIRPALSWSLGIAGSAPLWIAAVLLWSYADPVGTEWAIAMAIAYAGIVLAFLGGTRWGNAIALPDDALYYRERLISLIPGGAGLAALFLPPIIALVLLISVFLCQALWDLTSAEDGRLPQQSGVLRAMLTILCVTALLAVLGKILVI